jgi:hypothetical protein
MFYPAEARKGIQAEGRRSESDIPNTSTFSINSLTR